MHKTNVCTFAPKVTTQSPAHFVRCGLVVWTTELNNVNCNRKALFPAVSIKAKSQLLAMSFPKNVRL